MNIKLIEFDNLETLLPETLSEKFVVYENCQDPVSNWIANNRILFEHYVLYLIKPLLQSSFLLVDIGSNIGSYSYFYKNFANPKGHMICIDANSINLELLKINCKSSNDSNYLNKFWLSDNSEKSTFSQQDLPIKSYFKHSLSLQESSGQAIDAISNSELVSLIKEKFVQINPQSKAAMHYFIKIDVDGNEKHSAQELFQKLKSIDVNFFALVEVNDPSTYVEICQCGMIPKALLPGNNFLFASSNLHTNSDCFANDTYALIAAYSNRLLDVTALENQSLIIDKREIYLKTRFGTNIAKCRVMSKYWWDTLKNEPILAVTY